MRQSVPFIGEDLIVRGDTKNDGKHPGKLIAGVLDKDTNSSSWDEIVPNWPTRAAASARASVSKPSPTKKSAPVQAQIDWKPIRNGHCLRINISGKLDLELRKEWQRLLRETAASSAGQFEFNLTRTPELSLTGLGMLLLFKDQKKSQRQDIKLSDCNRQIFELLQWTGMDKYFVIHAKPGDALKSE